MFLSFPLLSLKIEGQACSSALGVHCPSFPPAAGGMGVLVAQERAWPCPARPAGARRRARGATRPVVTVPARGAVPAGGPVLTVCLSALLQACSAKRTSTTAPGAPAASTAGSAWTGSGGTAAAACPASPGRTARGTSTSACPAPAALRAAWTACSSSTTTGVSAAAPSPVSAHPHPRQAPRGADDGDPGPVRRRPDPREASLRHEKPGQPESRAQLFLGPVLAPCTLQSRSTFPFLPRRVFSFVIH